VTTWVRPFLACELQLRQGVATIRDGVGADEKDKNIRLLDRPFNLLVDVTSQHQEVKGRATPALPTPLFGTGGDLLSDLDSPAARGHIYAEANLRPVAPAA
jgi:hypothetical protein